jgi:nitroreductase
MTTLSAYDVLTTTRSVRKRLDLTRPVPLDLIRECLTIALQSPSGSNSQKWHFMVVTDAAKKQAIADLYRKSWRAYAGIEAGAAQPKPASDPAEAAAGAATGQVLISADYLALHMHEVPVWMIPCIEGRVDGASNSSLAGFYGSILPATWSFMLAARMKGLASCWTSLHLRHEAEAAAILGIPYEAVTQAALIPVAYPIGDSFSPAKRKPIDEVLHVDTW